MNFESLFKPEKAGSLPDSSSVDKAVGPDCGSKPPMECDRLKKEWAAKVQKQHQASKRALSGSAQEPPDARFGHNFAHIQVHNRKLESPAKAATKPVSTGGKKEEKP